MRAAHAAYSLHLDVVALQATRALAGAGVPSIVLKGPSIAQWLYADGAPRLYDDCDLLVPVDRLPVARRVLADLGYACRYSPLEDAAGAHADHHAEYWRRDDARIDLHWRIPGATHDASRTWRVLETHTEPLTVANATLTVLDVPARALHVALHAAQHRATDRRPVADVERLVRTLPDERWSEVRALADELDATGALAVGLERVETGADVVERHGIRRAIDQLHVALRAVDAPPATFGLAAVTRSRTRDLARVLFPPPAMLAEAMPLARRGRAGLAAAYAFRLVDRSARLPAAYRALRRARRLLKRPA